MSTDQGIALPLPLAVQGRWIPALGRLLLLWLLAGIVAWAAMAHLLHIWLNSTTYTYALLVPPLTAWLAWRERGWLRLATPRPAGSAALPLLGAALLLLLARAADVAVLGNLAAVTLVVAAVPAALGWAIAWRLRFPLLFLFTTVPVADPLIPGLQDLTADIAVPMLRWIGIPVFRDGVLMLTPTGAFEVAEACAGLRFLIANVVLGLLFAQLSFRSPWKKLGFVGLCLGVPILANAIRAGGIVAIAHWTDMRHAVGADHLVYGWGFFTAVMLVLILLGQVLADPVPPVPAACPPRPAARPGSRLALPLAALAVLAPPAYGWTVLAAPSGLPALAMTLPPLRTDWAHQPGRDGGWRVQYPSADRLILDSYAAPDGASVQVMIAAYALERDGAEIVHTDNRPWDGAVWSRVGRFPAELPGLPPGLAGDRLSRQTSSQRLVVSWYWVDGHLVATPLGAKLRRLWATLAGRHGPAAVIALSTEGSGAAGGTDPALARLAVFASGAGFTRTLSALAAGPES